MNTLTVAYENKNVNMSLNEYLAAIPVTLEPGKSQFQQHCLIYEHIRQSLDTTKVHPEPVRMDDSLFDTAQLSMYRDQVARTIFRDLMEGGLI